MYTEKPLVSLGCLIEVVKASVLSSTGTSVAVQENTVTSKRTGIVNYRQAERDTIIPVTVWQREAVITTEYKLDVYPLGFEWTAEDTSTKELSVNSFKVYYLNGKETSRVKIGYRVYRENIIGDKDKFDILPDKSGFNVSPCGMNLSSNEYYMDFEIIQNESNKVSQTIVLSQLSY